MGLARKLFYIFLLGASTYAWWKFNSTIKRRLDEEEARNDTAKKVG